MDDGPTAIVVIVIAVFVGALVGGSIGHSVGVKFVQQEAVNHGHALWVPNQTDGSVKFTWTPEEK